MIARGFLWLVTAIDLWCCQWLTVDQELNPLARWIMAFHGGVWTLVSVKVFTTFIVTECLRHLPKYYSWIMVGYGIALLLLLALL